MKVQEDEDPGLNASLKAKSLSLQARKAATMSAMQSKLEIERFNKDTSGVPVPSNGIWWSISHKPGAVAGVVSLCRVGIDIEEIKPVSKALFERILDPKERLFFSGDRKDVSFFRVFTSKEAVLKMNGLGIGGLSGVKIHSVIDETNLEVICQGKKVWVENFINDGYLASVTKDKCNVCWITV